LYLVNEPAAGNIKRYVENGGTLLMTFFSGIVDENEHIRLEGYPAQFRKMLGLTVEEYAAYPAGLTNTIRTPDGQTLTCSLWSDVIRAQGCQSLAAYESDYFAGLPAITSHKYGQGTGLYLGTELEPAGIQWLISLLCAQAGITPVVQDLPAGVEALRRSKDGKSWLFLLNHTGGTIQVPLETPGCNLLTAESVNNNVTLENNGVAVIELNDF
jgi:beta-galactosidase